MEKREKSLRELIVDWEKNQTLDEFIEIIKLIKNKNFYSPINELNNFKVENIISLDGRIFIPVYIGIEQNIINNKVITS